MIARPFPVRYPLRGAAQANELPSTRRSTVRTESSRVELCHLGVAECLLREGL